MRRFYFSLLIAALMLGLPCRPASAIGNVLVPTDDSNPSADSNKSPDALPAPPASSGDTYLPPEQGAMDMPSENKTPAPLGYTPIPAPPTPAAMNFLPPPTKVIKVPVVEPVANPNDKNLTNSLSVSLPEYLWGPDDVGSINRSLGIPADRVTKTCSLEVVGTLVSDTGGYIFDLKGSPSQSVLRYGGRPSGINVMTRAMCDMVPLPPNAGMVMQIGDKYAVFITQTQCPPPSAGARSLTYQYTGNGKANCAYQ